MQRPDKAKLHSTPTIPKRCTPSSQRTLVFFPSPGKFGTVHSPLAPVRNSVPTFVTAIEEPSPFARWALVLFYTVKSFAREHTLFFLNFSLLFHK